MVELEEGQRGRTRKKDMFIEGAIMGLGRNQVPEKFPGIHKNDSR